MNQNYENFQDDLNLIEQAIYSWVIFYILFLLISFSFVK